MMQLKFLALSVLLVVATSALHSQANKANGVLLSAMSPFEDMIEYGLAGNAAEVSKALAAAEQDAAKVAKALPVSVAKTFGYLMNNLRDTSTVKNYLEMARNATAIFRLLSDNLQAEALDLPKEVSLLDYAGFNLRVLAASPKPDWRDIRKTVDEAAGWWDAVNSKVSQNGLRNAFGTLIRGLVDAAKSHNLPMLLLAAQMELDLVDLLEGDLKPKP